MAGDYFEIKMTKQDMVNLLEKELSSCSYPKLVAETIIDNLALTEIGLQQVFKALRGLKVQLKYSLGDELWMSEDQLYTWRADKDKMRAEGLIHQGKLLVQIIELRPNSLEPYMVQYTYVNTAGETLQEKNKTISEELLFPADQFPLDL